MVDKEFVYKAPKGRLKLLYEVKERTSDKYMNGENNISGLEVVKSDQRTAIAKKSSSIVADYLEFSL